MEPTATSRLITHASLLDGTGAPARDADILIVNGLIDQVAPAGTLSPEGHEVVDAGGMTVVPGFIDVHSHADNAPFLAEDDTSKILQGVTTEVVGNCGFSLAPVGPDHADTLDAYTRRLFPPLPWGWSSFAELLAATDAAGYVTNYAPLLGHHAVRIAVLGMEQRAPSAEEQQQMEQLVDEAMEQGAFGLSSGLIYPPGQFCETEELVGLARRLPQGRTYVTHMRGEGTGLMSSLHEAVRIAREAGAALQVSHLKVAGRNNWGSMDEALQVLHQARDEGLTVTHDAYPYTAGSTMLTAALPPWFQDGGNAAVLRRLHSESDLDRLRSDLEKDDGSWENVVVNCGWSGVVVSSTGSHQFEGMSLAQIAEATGHDPFGALVEVLVQEELQASMVIHMMHEDDLQLALQHPLTMIGSDGLPPGAGGKPHPRMYGTFPRVLSRYVRDIPCLTLPEAVRRMTSLPAATFGLADRGQIAAGKAADLVCLDPARIVDTATYEDPTKTPDGISWVVQNGVPVVEDGRYLGRRSGARLLPTP